MKTMKLYTALTLITAFSVISSCNKDVNPNAEKLTPLQPANIDAAAGTWKLFFMTTITQIPLAAPLPVTDPTYVAELTAIKDTQSKLNQTQRAAIDYWSGGGILRWNQILRELVARYNLPPAPRADGTYPVPDSENPFADPQFPFSNPPYAARAYSYVAVAQADAMKVAWYYKYQFNRAAPYTNDTGVQALVPRTELPAYPSEDAVMSGVTAEILKSLFPAAVEEITLKAGEQRNAALWSGKASSTDISAGLALGKSIAALFTARAAGDGMKNAIGTKPQWQALADGATARGETPWVSLDSPARPPMLPFFGQVKTWMMTPAQIVTERPLPPPSTSSAEMKNQVSEVKYYADNLTRDRIAIVHKWADGAGTYTPPGHWNDIAAEYIRDANYSEVRAARAFALMNMALHDAAVGCWDTKYFYFNPRPTQMDASIKTGTGIPNFPAYTSGHSTFSAAAATVLSYLFPQKADYFNQQANEASLSRLYGAIHYRADIDAGSSHGQRIATYTINFASTDGAGN
jgi:hypothetical protein